MPPDTGKNGTLHYPFNDRFADPYNAHQDGSNGLYLGDPSNIKTDVEYNPEERQYDINERMGSLFYRNPSYMTFDEFVDNEYKKSTRNYFRQRSNEESVTQRKGFAPKLYVGGEAFNRIFGGNTIDIRPQGSAELIFGLNVNRYDNPTLPERQRKTTNFVFDEKIQMSVIGNIGEKLKLTTNYNTEASFDFENTLKLEYSGQEDEIIKKIEAGNVSLPLTGSLIQGSQSLFGIKTQLQFGKLTFTGVYSSQKGKNSTIEVKGGATITPFDVQADQYESNKHFFLSEYFGKQYDAALAGLPFINSQINITRLEVWVTNVSNITQDNRSVVALLDLGDNDFFNKSVPSLIYNGTSFNNPLPSDSSNSLYYELTVNYKNDFRNKANVQNFLQNLNPNFKASRDFEVIQNAKKLNVNEYTFNRQLGYISLNQNLNPNQVLAVAYEYTIGNKVYKVGEVTTDGVDPSQTLALKLLKGQITTTQLPTWDLMMKNIYALGGYQVDKKDFRLDVLYYTLTDSIALRTNFLTVPPSETKVYNIKLNRLFNLDRLNVNNDPRPDGEYDFIEGVTINSANGRIIFPVREPFGRYLRSKFVDTTLANNFAFDALYDSTKTLAAQQPEKNRFSIKGSYSSKVGSDIPLNAINIPVGSVKVTAGGVQLTENVQYTVDYNLGRVKIIDQGILASGSAIQISLESNSLFSIQSKTMMGGRFDYVVNKDFTLGGTFLRLNERPITQKVNIGDEPISNIIWGVDGSYRTQSRMITKLIDKLPMISTKEVSNVSFNGEFAQLIPGNNRAIGKDGTAYIDDFEGSQSTIDLRNVGSWYLSSTPSSLFPEANVNDNIKYGFNRAKMSWYIIDQVFYRNQNNGPKLPPDDLSNHLVRQIPEQEIFPYKQAPNGQTQIVPVFNLSYFPAERGPYNYCSGPTDISSGVDFDGKLKDPETRWGGIMRRVETTDFEAANVEFIQFWVMDPFNDNSGNTNGGELYFDLGNISEDILKDGKLSYENGLPRDGDKNKTDSTSWGLISEIQPPVTPYAFDFNSNSRQYQDLGLDGLNDDDEKLYFSNVIDSLYNYMPPALVNNINDLSSDNFIYYRNPNFDNAPDGTGILDRYRNFSNQQGNSPENSTDAGTSLPDVEDVNRDFNQNGYEQFYEYKVRVRKNEMFVGQNYIVDKVDRSIPLENGSTGNISWYQFKIPIRDLNAANGVDTVGGLEGFNTINFIRMYMTGFEEPMTLRFAKLEFLRGEWRKYNYDLWASSECLACSGANTTFDVSVVNLEENGNRTPINYVLPPGINQEINIGSTTLQQLNEQSLSLKVCDLSDGDARAAFKNLSLDLRSYNKVKMYVHAESSPVSSDALKNGDLTMFVRFGTDFKENFYEYEIPLVITPPGTTSPETIWPEVNSMELELDKFINLKLERNSSDAGNLTKVFKKQEEGTNNFLSIIGNPSLSNVRTIMIGVRNPLRDNNNPGSDDGNSKCGEIWVNELRLTDFDKRGGYAASGRLQAKLANLGNVAVSASYKSIGFGALEQKISERRRSDETAFNVASTLYLGKFLPEKTGIDIPMYVNYGTVVSNPQFDPLNEDVPYKQTLATAETKAQRKEIKKRSQNYTRVKSINFTNVKKNRTGANAKAHIYDVENLNFTYAYDELYHRDINIESDITKTHRGSIGYNFNTNPKGIAPFSKSKSLKSMYLRPIKDFNVNFVPSSFNFRTELIRTYGEKIYRNNTGVEIAPDTFFNKNFEMRRTYDIRHDITKSLKFDLNASNYSLVDEPEGRIDTETEKDVVKKNFWSFGRNKQYQHSGNLNYTVPLNKFPLTDWISVNAKYGFSYGWQAGQFVLDSARNIYGTDQRTGNTIQNSNTKQLNGNFTMTTLYNKIKFLKNINSPKPKPPAKPKPEPKKTAVSDTTGGKKPAVAKQKTPGQIPDLVRYIGKAVMGVKTVGLTYSETNGTLMPGYNNYSQIFGQDLDKGSPGFAFAVGSQKDLRETSAQNGWITGDTSLNNLYTNTYVQNITGRASIEPINGVKIELTANKNYTQNNSEFFRYNGSRFEHQSLTETGSYSISWIAINTAFTKDNTDDYTSAVFEEFSKNRVLLSERLAAENQFNSNGLAPPDSFGIVYHDGYGGTQQEVMTLAFISAYSGISAEKISLNPFIKVPKPNWRITYDGLSKIPLFKKIFNNVTLSHSYRCSYNVNSFGRNLNYIELNGEPAFRDLSNNIIPRKEVAQVSISEQFGPLLGVDVTWKNNIQTRLEFKRDRNLSLAFTGAQLTEVKGNEWVFGFGYRIPKFRLPFKIGGKKRTLGGTPSSSLNLTVDLSSRKNVTIIRRLIEGINEPSGGLNVFSIKVSADYAVNERLNVRLFYEQAITTPVISTSYPTSNTNAGVSLRFSLSQ